VAPDILSRTVRIDLHQAPGWRVLVDQLHDEAGLTEHYDDELIRLLADEVAHSAIEEVWELQRSAERRRELIVQYRRTKNAAAATAATRA